jgi:predicted NUDIX family NTP pyrophosphohydrolase
MHPGGPLWAKRDAGSWSIPKGLYDPGEEEPLAAAHREFAEETGQEAPDAVGDDLGVVRQGSGKTVAAFALAGDLETTSLCSNEFEMEWPPHSGARVRFPEVDRGEWFDVRTARDKILPGQAVFIDRLVDLLATAPAVRAR